MQIGAHFKGMSKGIKARKRAERVETVAPRLEQALPTVGALALLLGGVFFFFLFQPSVIISAFQKEQIQR